MGGNPLVARVSDSVDGDVTTAVDLLGRVVSHTDRWGETTTSAYDQAGRLLTQNGPQARLDADHDAAGRVTFQYRNDPGALLRELPVAVASYDSQSGELTGVTYTGNGTAGAIARSPSGALARLTWTGPANSAIADDAVVRSQSGKVLDEAADGADANPAGANFAYDAAGRLVEGWTPGHHLVYGFAPSGGCGTLAAAGKNADRTSVSDNGATATTYCYNRLDQLTLSSDPGVGSVGYDGHGDATTLGNQTLAFDSADRHTQTVVSGGPTVSYVRDGSNRITSRTEGTTVTRYGFAGPGDSPAVVLDASNQVLQRTIPLLGGAMLTKQSSGDVWSYPNVHGDVIATANALGAKQGGTLSYDPFGQGSTPDNSSGNFDYGWLGQQQRPTEHAGSIATIEMGARPYLPAIGRCLSVDPVEGGSCNDYDYACGDPVNRFDRAGTCVWDACVGETVVLTGIGLYVACKLFCERAKPKLADPKKLPGEGPYRYVPPKRKGNPDFIRTKDGGFLDEKGRVWKWDMLHKDHWDVQNSGGGRGNYTNVYPDGSIRGPDNFSSPVWRRDDQD